MMEVLKYSHPMNQQGERYNCKELSKEAQTGSHTCCMGTTDHTEFDKLGVGLTLYFRFLKTLVKYFLILGVISLPMIVISCVTYNVKRSFTDNFQNDLYSTTLGSITDQNMACGIQSQQLKSTNSKTNSTYVISLDCFGGIIDVDSYIFGLVTDQYDQNNKECKIINRHKVDKKCNRIQNGQEVMKTLIEQKCKGKNRCEFDFQQTNINNKYLDYSRHPDCKQYSNNNLFISTFCKNQVVPLIGNKSIRLSNVSFIAGVIDFLVILVFIYMLVNLELSGKKARNNVLNNSLSPNLFTIEVRNFAQNMQKDELIDELWNYYENLLNEKFRKIKGEEKEMEFKIIDVQVCQSSESMKENIIYNNLLSKKFDIIKIYRKDYDKQKKLPDMCHLKDIKLHCQVYVEEKKKKTVQKIINKLDKLEEKIKKQFKKLQECENKKPVINSAWITFETMEQKDIAMEQMYTTSFNRLLFNLFSRCCFKKRFARWVGNFKGKLLEPVQPPDPSNINWENLNYSWFNKLLRRSISLIITIILIIIGISMMVYLQAKSERAKEKYPDIDCKTQQFIKSSVQDVVNEYKTQKYIGYTSCFCSNNLSNYLTHEFKEADNQQLCYIWFTNEVQARAYPILMAIVISIINLILTIIFKVLTSFERHSYVSLEMASKVSKLFISQLLNTGLMIGLINARITSFGIVGDRINKWLGGRYMGFNGQWYQDVGSTIILTMLIQVFSVPSTIGLIVIIKKLVRFIDRGCTQNLRKTKKKKQSDYQNLYIGTEFIIDVRYSQVLTMVYTCMIYSTGIPILYFTTCAQLFLTYWVDKFVIFTFCKKIQNIDDSLQKMINYTLYGCIFIHTIFSIYIIGSPNIFYQGVQWDFLGKVQQQIYQQTNVNQDDQNGYFQKLFIRATQPQCYLVAIIFFIFLIIIFMQIFLYQPFVNFTRYLFEKCFKKRGWNTKQYKNPFRKDIFYSFMHKSELDKEIKLIRLQLNESVQNVYFSQSYKAKLVRRKNELAKQLEQLQTENNQKQVNRFISQFSYDLRHDQKFYESLGISEKMKKDIESEYNLESKKQS